MLIGSKLIVWLAFLCLPVLSCQQDKTYETLPVGEFSKLIAKDDVQRLDVRTPAEYSENHIPDAININVNREDFLAIADSLLSKKKKVALYCRSGNRSKKAATILSKNGFQIYELEDGFNAWIKDNKETVH